MSNTCIKFVDFRDAYISAVCKCEHNVWMNIPVTEDDFSLFDETESRKILRDCRDRFITVSNVGEVDCTSNVFHFQPAELQRMQTASAKFAEAILYVMETNDLLHFIKSMRILSDALTKAKASFFAEDFSVISEQIAIEVASVLERIN